jgi:hypothetical protein
MALTFHVLHRCGSVEYNRPRKGSLIMIPSEYSMLPYVATANAKPTNWLTTLQAEADRRGLLLPTQYNGTPPVDDASGEIKNLVRLHKSDDDNLLLPPFFLEHIK